ncbi:uncharacterized, partial [Tachysurus ichikawai]
VTRRQELVQRNENRDVYGCGFGYRLLLRPGHVNGRGGG